MPSVALLTYYCVFILLASIAGGMIPVWFRLTHRAMEFAVSFVAGLMLGVALLHMLPHALLDAAAADADGTNANDAVMTMMAWVLVGFLVMFFIERFFCYHHHDVPLDVEDEEHLAHEAACAQHGHDHTHAHQGDHDITWSGAALGLFLHSLLNGVALGASVQHGDGRLAGLGTFLVIFLHKPFDAMTIGMLMARGGSSLLWRHAVNALFSLAIPLGVLVFYFGLMPGETDGGGNMVAAYALAFSAGTFLCIASSDLLPELKFHRHDRVALSAALLFGLGVAVAVAWMETLTHGAHSHGPPPAATSVSEP